MEAGLGVLYVVPGIVTYAVVRYMPFMGELRIKKRLMYLSFSSLISVQTPLYLYADDRGHQCREPAQSFFAIYLLCFCTVI